MSAIIPCLNSLKRLNKSIKIGTHDGVFHCDEVLGTFMLQLLIPESTVVRSRNDEILKECDIVIDVGNIYNPSKYLFDHHQKDFNESISSIIPGKKWTTKLSSAGLVYCHFGKDVLKKITGETEDSDKIEALFDHIYENFIEEIDGIDNGYPMFDGEPRYRITTNLSSRVQRFNEQWNQKHEEFNEQQAFFDAQNYVGKEFVDRVKNASSVWWPARKLVIDAINDRFRIDQRGIIIELETFCPWKEHFFNLEKELNIEIPILYVIFGTKDNWRVQAVSVNTGSYICRLFLPSEWHGLRNEELCKVSNIDGCIFVHHTGFIGGNTTREGALKMALKSIELSNL